MLFAGNSAVRSACSGRQVGKLIAGASADVLVVDYDPPTPVSASNLKRRLLFGFSGRSAVTTIIGGRVVMEDRRLLAIDEIEVMAKAHVSSSRLLRRF